MAHYFDHETAPGGHCRLLDLIDCFHDAVQGRISPDAELGAGQIVIDRSRQADDRNIEGREIRPGNQHGVNRFVPIPAAHHQQRLDVFIFDDACNGVQITALRHHPAGTQHGSAQGSPAAHAHPIHFLHFPFCQPFEAVLNSQHDMTLVESQADGCPGGSVHPGSGSA